MCVWLLIIVSMIWSYTMMTWKILNIQIRFGEKASLNNKNADRTSNNNKHNAHSFEKSTTYKRFKCKKWGVVTTIFEPSSEAVRRFLYRKQWCLVVVGDKGKPKQVMIIQYNLIPDLLYLLSKMIGHYFIQYI